MRRSLERLAIAFTVARVGPRRASRSVSRTQALDSRNVGVGISCNISGSCSRTKTPDLRTRVPVANRCPSFWNTRTKKERLVSRLPFGAFRSSAGSTGPTDSICVRRLLGRSFSHRNYRNESAAVTLRTKLDMAFDLGEESMVGAHADIKAGMPGGAALTCNDVAGNDTLAAERLDSEAFACRITTVTR